MSEKMASCSHKCLKVNSEMQYEVTYSVTFHNDLEVLWHKSDAGVNKILYLPGSKNI